MAKFLNNRKILFITTQFYGYEQGIIKSMKDYGADLKVYYDDPVSYTRIKFLKNWISRRTRTKVNRFYRAFILRKTAGLDFDYIFFLKGSIMSEPFLKALRQNHPHALLLQYQWDSLTNFNYEHLISCFDVSYTFDPADAERVPSLKYLPTFALDEFFQLSAKRRKVKQSIDISFVGSNHSDRLKTLRGLRSKLSRHNLKYKFYVYLPFIVSITSVLFTRRMKPNEFMLKSLSRKKYKTLLLKSRYVLDLPSPKQTGVSLRTYEALASGCGLITTSKNIAKEPFFNDKQIFIVDPGILEESIPGLIKQDPGNDESLSFEEYSSSSWVRRIFSIASMEEEKIKTYKMEKME
jgi:hypothetical protein